MVELGTVRRWRLRPRGRSRALAALPRRGSSLSLSGRRAHLWMYCTSPTSLLPRCDLCAQLHSAQRMLRIPISSIDTCISTF